jgi:hypothetical protein
MADKFEEAVLAYLRALRDRLTAEQRVETLAGTVQRVAAGLKEWRQRSPGASTAGMGERASEPGELPAAQELVRALEEWRRTQERENKAWNVLPREWQEVLRQTPHPTTER